MKKSEKILKEVEEKIEQPFVTPKFGDSWREHNKRMFNKGEITVDMLLDIAWKQGRKALLLESVVKELADKQ